MPGWRAVWILALIVGAGPAVAETASNSDGKGNCVMPATSCVVTVHKGAILRLPERRPAKIVLVADPEIADVVIQSPKLLFILGRQPGETNLFVLDRDEKEIHKIDIIVRRYSERPVTIYRSTEETTLSCAPRCVIIRTTGVAAGADQGTAAPAAAQGGNLTGAAPGTEAQAAAN